MHTFKCLKELIVVNVLTEIVNFSVRFFEISFYVDHADHKTTGHAFRSDRGCAVSTPSRMKCHISSLIDKAMMILRF